MATRRPRAISFVADSFRVLSLCSGVGAFELGIEAASPRARVLAYVEREAFAASRILARMEEQSLERAPLFCGDLADLSDADLDALRADGCNLITGGFPCQPWSAAGKRKGTADERWLFDDIARIVERIRPRFVLFENVAGLVSGRGLNHVIRTLAVVGYGRVEWLDLAASAVGASHKRRRLFVLAMANADGELLQRIEPSQESRTESEQSPRMRGGNAYLGPTGTGSIRAERGKGELANADDARSRRPRLRLSERRPDEAVSDIDRTSEALRRSERRGRSSKTERAESDLPLFAFGPDERDRWLEILERRPELAPALSEVEAETLADVRGMAHGLADRSNRLRAIGNGIVPLQAAIAFGVLLARLVGIDEAEELLDVRIDAELVGACYV